MTYALSAPLQRALYNRLTGDAALTALIGASVYDTIPSGTIPSTYVTIGDEDVRDRSDKDAGGALHDFTITVITDSSGFQTAKAVAAAISDSLVGGELHLDRGRIVGIWFQRAKARRIGSADQRRIDLRFRAQVEDN